MSLKISREQMQAMVQNSEAMFLTALERLVRSEHAAVVADLPAELLQKMLRQACVVAKHYGMADPPDIAGFVMLMFEFGPQFHEHPAIHAVLTETTRPAHQRLQAVARNTAEPVWRAVEATLHKQRWFEGD
ncbi:hypothetical protein POL68_36285 [Stigmatella sp. ncwal1]|uniref:DUF2267 domain-containing protein n=1 Tax=Stigmatella ashevillensis TaxID=2995309 RepID=A0ABT5DJZ5_9BACT|nr:hypothetical protein [Stigmatella ashevillena]MDC0713981.1 hypothetical protein [Stigmatella ashevillena]